MNLLRQTFSITSAPALTLNYCWWFVSYSQAFCSAALRGLKNINTGKPQADSELAKAPYLVSPNPKSNSL